MLLLTLTLLVIRVDIIYCPLVGLLNLRGNDRPTSPLFDAYMIVTMDEIRYFLRKLCRTNFKR